MTNQGGGKPPLLKQSRYMATTNNVVEYDYAFIEVAPTKTRNKWALTIQPKDGEQAEKYVIICDRYDLHRFVDEVYYAWLTENM